MRARTRAFTSKCCENCYPGLCATAPASGELQRLPYNDPSSRNLPKNIPLACTALRSRDVWDLGFGILDFVRVRDSARRREGDREGKRERKRKSEKRSSIREDTGVNPGPLRIGIRAAPVYLADVMYRRNTAKGGRHRRMK